MFCCCNGVFEGCVYYYNFLGCCSRYIDIVNIDVCLIDYFKVGCCFDYIWCGFSCGVYCKVIIFVNDFYQFFFGQINVYVDFNFVFFKYVNCLLIQFVGN